MVGDRRSGATKRHDRGRIIVTDSSGEVLILVGVATARSYPKASRLPKPTGREKPVDHSRRSIRRDHRHAHQFGQAAGPGFLHEIGAMNLDRPIADA